MADLATTEAESRHCGVTPRPRGQRGEAEVVQLGAQRGPRPRGRAPAGAGPSEADAARLSFRLWEGPLGGLTSPARVPLQPLCKNTAHGHAGSFVLHLRPPG